LSGILNLSRNLGHGIGASLMGGALAVASAASGMTTASPEAITTGRRVTFAIAAPMFAAALAIEIGSHVRATSASAGEAP